jgi:hypothetical protein
MISLTTSRTFVIVIFLGLFSMAARNVIDPDVWWHLKTGEYISVHHAVPRADIFSYTRAGQPWVAHEWLTELFLYKLQSLAGFPGMIFFFAAVLTLAFVLLYLRCGPAPYIAGIATLLGAWATMPVWGVRPQVLSLLLTSLWLLILERSSKNPKLLLWTVPLTLLWVNLHAGFALGLAIFALYFFGSFLEYLLDNPRRNPPFKIAASVFMLDLLVVPLNPNGYQLYTYPLETLRSPAMQTYIAEWASPNFHHHEHWPLMIIILATFATLLISRLELRARDALLLLASLYAALTSVRMIPFFVLIATPIISRRLGNWPRTRSNPDGSPLRAGFNVVIVLATALFAIIHISQVFHHQPEAEAQDFPARAVAFLQSHPPSGPIFNHYDWGGYLIGNLPSTPVFIDGRADVYGEAVFNDFATIYQLKHAWRQTLERWHIQNVIVPTNSPLAAALRLAPQWAVHYQDSQAIIFSRPPQ